MSSPDGDSGLSEGDFSSIKALKPIFAPLARMGFLICVKAFVIAIKLKFSSCCK